MTFKKQLTWQCAQLNQQDAKGDPVVETFSDFLSFSDLGCAHERGIVGDFPPDDAVEDIIKEEDAAEFPTEDKLEDLTLHTAWLVIDG